MALAAARDTSMQPPLPDDDMLIAARGAAKQDQAGN
jgi:hypothetical protein